MNLYCFFYAHFLSHKISASSPEELNLQLFLVIMSHRYFQHAHFIPIVGVGKRGAY